MKKLNIITAAILCMIAGTINTIAAQRADSTNVRPPVFGFGFKIAQISVSDFFEDVMPGNKFLMTITPHKNFRLEGSFGFLSRKSESERGTELPGKSLFYGISAFGMWQKGNTNFYGGLRFGFLNSSQLVEMQGYNSSSFEPYYYTQEYEGRTNTVGGVIGVEYYFSRHFTIGGEISLNQIKNEYKQPSSPAGNSTTDESKSLLTETGLVTRFYF